MLAFLFPGASWLELRLQSHVDRTCDLRRRTALISRWPNKVRSPSNRAPLMVNERNENEAKPSSTSLPPETRSSVQLSQSSESGLTPSAGDIGSSGPIPPNGSKGNKRPRRDDDDNDDDDDEDENGDGETYNSSRPFISIKFTNMSPSEVFQRAKASIIGFFNYVGNACRNSIKSVFKDIPIPIVAAVISATASLAATRIKMAFDANAARQSREEAQLQRRLAADSELRKNYNELSMPLLKAAAKLADHLYLLVTAGSASDDDDDSRQLSPVYSAYLVGRYLAAVEVLKNRHPLLDYGFPTADRILHNIVGRIQGIFCAGDGIMHAVQNSEQLFKPADDEMVLDGGLFKLTPRLQTVLGELLLRRTWIRKYDFLNAADDVPGGSNRIAISFHEFSRIYLSDESLRLWYAPLVEDFTKLESFVQSTNRNKSLQQKIGARVFIVQSGLIDLVTYFDPPPDIRVVPVFRRRRLQISEKSSETFQRMPLSLQLLFNELSSVRDYKSTGGDPLNRLHLPYGVEAHITSPLGIEDIHEGRVTRSPCPASQEVLLILTEMEVPYKTITIRVDSKPMWYYLLHPDNRTPVIYHDGNVIDDSSNMLKYLKRKYPENPCLASSANLNLRPGIPALTKFHDSFLRWLEGDASAKEQMEDQLRSLDRIIHRVQEINRGSPLFGGNRFSREDVAIVPYLHRIDVAGRLIKNWGVSKEHVALRRYLEAARNIESFKRTVSDDEVLVESYASKVIARERLEDRLADFLE